jgi:subfamily B ATP-binding cassette protein MsbA
MERLIEMFNVVPEFTNNEITEHGIAEHGIRPEKITGEIRFSKVYFYYKKDKPVLTDISFTIHPGEIIALTGASGAGKTTLISLIIKFNLPRSGCIYLDGHDLKDIDTRWLRNQIGFVSQDIFLFNDTIENNIKYGNPSASLDEVIQAAKKANIHYDIEKFQDGYQTMVGERGTKLSAGQRQRVSIARAFLKNPPILIFDEPTSALDPDTESSLKNSLKELSHNSTILMITHRMSVTDVATGIFVLEGGMIKIRRDNESSKAVCVPLGISP